MSGEQVHRSAGGNLGGHLLGRRPMPKDERDYRLEDYVESHARLSQTLTPDTRLGDLQLSTWHDVYAFWAWFKANVLNQPKPAPAPAPAPGPVVWTPGPISDQGQTSHCVGFTGLDWGNALPVNDGWPNAQGHDIYYECKVVDGEPGQEDGSDSRALCKALANRRRIGAYAFTTSLDTLRAFVRGHGPVGIGINWYDGMFHPDADGYVRPTGAVAGGHEVLVTGHLPGGKGATKEPSFVVPNHWGTTWADHGICYITEADMAKLLADQGDCWAGLELPL